MKRVVGYAVGLAVLVAVLFIPAALFNYGSADDSPESTTITSYVADFTLDESGDLAVVEQLTVDFPYGRHGIFRFFDRADPSAPHARRVVHDISVSFDDGAVPVEYLSEDHGRFKVAKIGSPTQYVTPGQHVYVIRYSLDGVIEPGSDGSRSQFYWNLVPGGWKQEIDATNLTVHLPVAAEPVQCATGAGATSGCTAKGEGSTTLHVRTGHLPANTPVTIKAGLDMATPPAGDTRPWAPALDPVLGPNAILLGLVVLIGLAGFGLGARIAARARETNPQFPLMYAPPEGIGPAQAQYLLTEDVDRSAYVGTLMYAAEKGAVSLDRDGDTWSITDQKGAEGWAGLDPVSSGVAHLLGGPGTTFVASKKDVEAGKRLKTEIGTFDDSVKGWAKSSGHMVASGLGSAGSLVVIAGLLAALAIAIFNPLSMSMVGLVPGAFAIGAFPLVRTGSGTRRTASGRDLWSRIGGFHRVLSTPSSKDRFDFAGRQELYTAYIPWAVALGCTKEWADKYRTETGSEPPVPSYLAGAYVGSHYNDPVSSMVDDFSSTVDSAISSYQATQSSSSSGGGGFSGGGGGGGGGGGSW
ncbi:putative membrane protein YgcG [Nocardioides ginsengisegetis]|uniref:Putative membrane protein YgcG n=1 Tax=Nocardioides ginsengisegetis TaxID=661491 RepID=A0A7W3IWP1_9ACTN|nr:DUF2207 domain-containing protein [Nocardioides ginsengisegetis]MBA8801983.1 putative membrane protein YgcG [Nocardioides ginsengisegetis]